MPEKVVSSVRMPSIKSEKSPFSPNSISEEPIRLEQAHRDSARLFVPPAAMKEFYAKPKPAREFFEQYNPPIEDPILRLLHEVNLRLHAVRNSTPDPQLPELPQTAIDLPSRQTYQLSSSRGMRPTPYPTTGRIPQLQPHREDTPVSTRETPLYVNPKQRTRILKRRVARQKLQEKLGHTPRSGRSHVYESRHKHAKRRARGPQGQFLGTDHCPKP